MKFQPVRLSAPSKIILHGEHAVVYGKTAVAASIGLRTRMILTPKMKELDAGDCLIKVYFPDIGIEEGWTEAQVSRLLEKRPKTTPEEARKKKKKLIPSETVAAMDHRLGAICWFGTEKIDSGFLLEICAFLGVNQADLKMSSLICFFYLYALLCHEKKAMRFPPIHISVESNIPVGVGLGSSAALSVCLAAGLLSVRDQIFEQRTFPFSERRLWEVCQLAKISEEILHGKCSGIDNSVSTYGGLVTFADFSRKSNDVLMLSNFRVLLVGTNITRDTKQLVERVRKSVNDFPDVVRPVIDAIDAVGKDCLATLNKMSATHSNAVTLKQMSTTDGDTVAAFQRLEKLIDYNQSLLSVLDVSHPSLAKVCQIAAKHGLHAKLTGAGGGGYAFVLVPPYTDKATVDGTKQDLLGENFTCWETELGVEGVRFDPAEANGTS